MLLITEPFHDIVEAFGPTVGLTDYQAVAVPHPVSTLADDDLAKLAAAVLDEAERRLTAPQ